LVSATQLSAQQSYHVIAVTNGGTVSGTVKWSGPKPHLVRFPITKDPQICDPNSEKTRDLERLIIGPQGGVANTVVYLKEISAGKEFSLPPARRFLDQKHCRYEPHILLVPAGGTLDMKSSDSTLHTIHMEGAATYNLPFPFPNQVISRPMPSSGLVHLKCNGGHVWMNAEMFVARHPYYAVTDEEGKFELTNVPPGQYELVAWHEGWEIAKQEATFDVLTEKRVERPIFGDPKTQEKKVTVTSSNTTVVEFTLSEK
jgi:Carboxypeptidase regulatory-like domain